MHKLNIYSMYAQYFRKALLMLFLGFLGTAFLSCGKKGSSEISESAGTEKTIILAKWLEENGNYINSPEIPSIVDSHVVYSMRNDNILVIDLRPEADFNEGHIEYAINLKQSEVIDFFRNKINPGSFKGIFFVCNNMSRSGYTAGVMRLLGYDNVFAIRFGMSGWDRKVAEKYWIANVSNQLLGKLESTVNPKNKPGKLPEIKASGNTGYDIAMEMAEEILKNNENYGVTIKEWLENPDAYYTICYWPEDKYISNGHLPGSVQYQPKSSLGLDMELNTLPVDKPIVIYCYSGQHSTYVTSYIRMLGYDARSLVYGANAFIHETMAKTEPRPTRTFTENLIHNLPVVSTEITEPAEVDIVKEEKIKVMGGC